MEEENPIIVKELELTTGESNASSQPDKITLKEHLQTFCKISYRMRKLKNKGALLVLVWSFMVMCAVNYLFNVLMEPHYDDSVTTSVATIIGVTLPIAGWLADIRFGRYKVIRFSIWTMWITSVLLTIVYIVFSSIELSHSSLTHKALTISLALVLVFGVGAFQVTIIQF